MAFKVDKVQHIFDCFILRHVDQLQVYGTLTMGFNPTWISMNKSGQDSCF